MPNVGFFQPIGAEALPHTKLPVPKHVAVLREHFGLKDDPQVRAKFAKFWEIAVGW